MVSYLHSCLAALPQRVLQHGIMGDPPGRYTSGAGPLLRLNPGCTGMEAQISCDGGRSSKELGSQQSENPAHRSGDAKEPA